MRARHAFALTLAMSLAVAAIPRFCALYWDDSVFYPDEIFQTLEQGHRFAFGYGFIPWEFREAARSWLLPLVLGLVMKLGAVLGMTRGPALAHLARGFMVLLALVGQWATIRLAYKRGGIGAAILAGAIYAAFPPLLVFGARCTTEMASAALIACGALALLAEKDTTAPHARRALLGGALIGGSIFLRTQNGVAALTFFVVLLVQRRWRDARAYAVGGAAISLLAGGVLDWITWGAPFKSVLVYLRFNLIEGQSAHWGTSPWSYYVTAMWTACGIPCVLMLLGIAVSVRREWPLLSVIVVFLVAHSMVPHKQLRFLMPIIPLAITVSALGLSRALAAVPLPSKLPIPDVARSVALSLLLLSGFALKLVDETYGDMGSPGSGSVWKANEGATLLLGEAGDAADLCGLMLDGIDRGFTGAFSYLHRNVPFFNDVEPDAQRSANYLVAPRGARAPRPYRLVESRGTFTLYRRDGTCRPSPARYTPATGEDPMAR